MDVTRTFRNACLGLVVSDVLHNTHQGTVRRHHAHVSRIVSIVAVGTIKGRLLACLGQTIPPKFRLVVVAAVGNAKVVFVPGELPSRTLGLADSIAGKGKA